MHVLQYFMKLTSGGIKISTGILSISYYTSIYCMQSSSSVNVEIIVFSFDKQQVGELYVQ